MFRGMIFCGICACDMGKKGSIGKEDVAGVALKLAILGDSLVVGVMAETKMGEELAVENYLYKQLVMNKEKESAGKELSDKEKGKRRADHMRKNDNAYKKNRENAYSYGGKKGCSFSHACRMGPGRGRI